MKRVRIPKSDNRGPKSEVRSPRPEVKNATMNPEWGHP